MVLHRFARRRAVTLIFSNLRPIKIEIRTQSGARGAASDIDGKAAKVAARESGDERVQSPKESLITLDTLCDEGFDCEIPLPQLRARDDGHVHLNLHRAANAPMLSSC